MFATNVYLCVITFRVSSRDFRRRIRNLEISLEMTIMFKNRRNQDNKDEKTTQIFIDQCELHLAICM